MLSQTVGCSDDNDEENRVIVDPNELVFNFSKDAQGWTGDFADYPVGSESFYELSFGYSKLPSPLDQTKGALKQSGNNHSDDLFMFIKKQVTGLMPNHLYKVNMVVEFASNAADESVGVGGSPGHSVYLKVGATTDEPKKVAEDNMYRMNIDKSNQSNSGKDMVKVGDFANGTDKNVYKLKVVSNSEPLQVTSDENGSIWLVIGTDSGFEATTTIYYNSINVSAK